MSEEDLSFIMSVLTEFGLTFGVTVVQALLFLIIGIWFAGRVKALIARALNRFDKMDATLVGVLSTAGRYAILVLVITAILGLFGVEAASIIAVLGAAGLAIGLALQGTLSNVASGIMILLLRPYKLGDFVDAGGISGTVMDVGLFSTVMKSVDGIFQMVPNAAIWGGNIVNYSRNPVRRKDLVMSIAYSDTVDAAMTLLMDQMTADARVLKDPEPVVFISSLGASSVDITCRFWTTTGDFWETQWDLTKSMKAGLEADGFTIPFPQQDVYMHAVQAEAAE